MLKRIIFLLLLIFLSSFFVFSVSVGSDGGVTIYLTFEGDIDVDTVTDDLGTTWDAQDKFERDMGLFAEHVFEMTEGKHYIRQILVIDNGRSWNNSDIKWTNALGLSTGSVGGWDNIGSAIFLRRCFRDAIHEVISHEFGHYFYALRDEYLTMYASSPDYYQGYFSGTEEFTVTITGDCDHTIMNDNHPYQFCDTTDHTLTVTYTRPDTNETITGEVLTPALLTDGDPDNDGPLRSWANTHFAQDGWTSASAEQTDLTGYHTEGVRPAIDFDAMPELIITYVDKDDAIPGRILLLDRSGSMSHTTFGIPASQYVQEAGMYLYHSSEPTDFIGTYVYNANPEELFAYDQYDDDNILVGFYNPTGLTNIHEALETAIDTLVAEHGEAGVIGAEIFLLSDGVQTTGDDLFIQVDRAQDLGIIIHTFSYGAADTATMDLIATETAGEGFVMSEKNDNLMNLKLRLIKSISKTRGWTPVYSYYGEIGEKLRTNDGLEYIKLLFDVPSNCRDLKFYMMPEQNYYGHNKIVMKHLVSGFDSSNEKSNVQLQGRFSGHNVKLPKDGKWEVTIYGDEKYRNLPDGNIYLVGYIDNQNISAKIWVDTKMINIQKGYQKINVYAWVMNKYYLTNATVTLSVVDPNGNEIVSMKMNDTGQDNDQIALDGIYTAVLNTGEIAQQSKTLKYNLIATFDVSEQSYPAPHAEYEFKSDYKKLLQEFKGEQFHTVADIGIGLTREDFFAQVDTKDFDNQTVIPGIEYYGYLIFDNMYPDIKSLRINLGQGIKITKVNADRNNRVYTVHYYVEKDAEAGRRDLNIQWGNKKFLVKEALNVFIQATDSPTIIPTMAPTPQPTPTILFGDVNKDGSVDIVDSLLIAQYYVGLDLPVFYLEASDTNCDGNTDIVDALLVAQYFVGLILGFC